MKSLRLGVVILLGLMLAITPLLCACAEEEAPPPAAEEEEAPPPAAEEEEAPPLEPIELTFASPDSPPSGDSLADEAWIEKIERETEGRVHFTEYWGGTLIGAMESCAELVKGVADVSYISAAYATSGFDIDKAIVAFYYGGGSQEDRLAMFYDVWEQFPEYREPYAGMKVLAHVTSDFVLISKKPIRTLDDLKGLRVKAAGTYVKVMQALGAEGLTMPSGECYISLQKGTIDAAILPLCIIGSLKAYEVAKYCTELEMTGGIRPSKAMNINSWNNLPKDIQNIFEGSIAFWDSETLRVRAADDIEGYEAMKAAGVEFITLSEADLAKFYKVTDDVCLEEAAKLDAMGLPGMEIFYYIRSLIARYAD